MQVADYAIRTGTDTWLALFNMSMDTSDSADIYYMQRAAKNILYAEASSMVLDVDVTNWKVFVYILDVELAAMVVMGVIGIVNKNKKRKID